MQWDDEDNYLEEQAEYQAEENENYSDSTESYSQDPLLLSPEEETLLGSAMIRLDQARLYEMLVKHNLFEGVDANPIALKAVQKEIKTFIMDRLEILLGLKADKQSQPLLSVFNDLEIQTLKDLAFAASKGATRQEQKLTPSRTTLKPLSSGTQTSRTAPTPVARPVKPINNREIRTKKTTKSNNDFPPLNKNVSEMTSDELLERARISSDIYKGRTAVNPQALPPPTFEQQMLQYSTILSGDGIGSTLLKKLGGNGVYDVGDGE